MSETGEEVKELTGVNLSSALKTDSTFEAARSIILTMENHSSPKVEMTGFWDGNLLKAAMRAIERKYDDVRKHATLNAMKQSQALK